MTESSANSRRRFTIRTLLFLVLCVAGFLAGSRVGYRRGYEAGVEKRRSEDAFAATYDVSDVVGLIVIDPETGSWRPAGPDDADRAVPDVDPLIETITATISPSTWDEVGGEGSISELVSGRDVKLVVKQRPPVHEELESLLESLRNKDPDSAQSGSAK